MNCTCDEDEFQCRNGACIPEYYTCDWQYDCRDRSDEIYAGCICDPSIEFECLIGGCVSVDWVCDGQDDCIDGSDESECTTEGMQ